MVQRFAALLLLSSVLLAACGQAETATPTEAPLRVTITGGTWVEPPVEVSNFSLTDQDGQPFDTSTLRGRPVLMFFGFTTCPDICPTTLSEFAQVRRQLGQQAEQVAVLFISVDGSRDTPERIKRYVTAFDPSFIGLTGPEEQVREIGNEYGVFFERQELPNSATGYTVAHTATSFMLDQQGRLRVLYPYGTPPDAIVNDLRNLLAMGS